MPWAFSSFAASLLTALSAAAKNSGMASNTTTSLPKRRHTEPSSRPITPPPMTPKRAGTSVKSNAPVESTIYSLSIGATGISMGTEPEAKITFLAVIVVGAEPSNGVNSTCLSAPLPSSNFPVPCSQSAPLPFNNAATPPVNCLTIASLRLNILLMSIATSPVVIPWSAKSCLVAS